MVDNYAAFFNCAPVSRASDSLMAPTFILVGQGRSVLSDAWHLGSICVFLLLRVSVSYSVPRDLHRRAALTESVESSVLIHQCGYHDLFV